MITVKIYHDDDEIGRIRFTKIMDSSTPIYTVYLAEFGVERLGPEQSVGVFSRKVGPFPRLGYNVLALIKAALEEVDQEELKLDQPTRTPDMARRFNRTLWKVQTWKSRLRHH